MHFKKYPRRGKTLRPSNPGAELDPGRIPDSFPVVFVARHSLMGTGLALETAEVLRSCRLLSCSVRCRFAFRTRRFFRIYRSTCQSSIRPESHGRTRTVHNPICLYLDIWRELYILLLLLLLIIATTPGFALAQCVYV